MDAATRARKDIESIEKQIAHLEAAPGADVRTKQQLYELHRQVESLRTQFEMSTAWQKTELWPPLGPEATGGLQIQSQA